MAWSGVPIPATPTDLYTLLPRISHELPSCPEPVQKEALRLAAQQFCRDTEAWIEKLAPTTSASMASVELNALLAATYDAAALRVKYVWFPDNGRIVYENYYRLAPDGGDMDMVFTTSANIDQALTVATADGDMEIGVIVDPYDTCAAYPAWLLRRWGTAICAGALATVKLQTKKPWSDPQGGMLRQSEYQLAVGTAKASNITGRKSGEIYIQPQPFV